MQIELEEYGAAEVYPHQQGQWMFLVCFYKDDTGRRRRVQATVPSEDFYDNHERLDDFMARVVSEKIGRKYV